MEAEFALIERAQTWFRLAEEQEQPSANIDFVISVGERPVAQRQQQVQRVAETPLMANNDDPNAPYRLYDGDDRIGTYLTRAEARRAKQKLEDEAGEKQRLCVIKDKHEWIVL